MILNYDNNKHNFYFDFENSTYLFSTDFLHFYSQTASTNVQLQWLLFHFLYF